MDHTDYKKLSLTATLHCLLGCSVGEILGMIITTYFGVNNIGSIGISIFLAFVFGYSFSMIPLLKKMSFRKAYPLALASDTVSITTMELMDNLVIFFIPGALVAGLTTFLFWGSLTLSLFVAFLAAYPVNLYLIKRGKGHALIHQYHH
jgi:hypothetical protein